MRCCFYYEAKIIIEMREKLLTHGGVFTFCATFKRAINRPKIDPQIFFSQIYSSMDKLLLFQEEKK